MPTEILVVDDCPITSSILSSTLKEAGYRVHTADSGRAALTSPGLRSSALILLDFEMDDMNGFDVLKVLRADPHYADRPVLMISAIDHLPRVVEALDLGANDYLTKPLDAALLLAKVRRSLRTGGSGAVPLLGNLEPGMRLAHYEILSILGEGSMGRVYEARDVRLLRNVAVKVLHPRFLQDLERQQLFRMEALAAARISHPNVVQVYDVGTEPLSYMAMELINGRMCCDPCFHLPLQPKRAVEWFRQILSGLAAAHAQNVIHRDLKPDNIMVLQNGLLKLMDFGVAKLPEFVDPVKARVVGTPQYMSPEQVDRSIGRVTVRSDIFSAAGILYTLLTGSPPFPASHPAQQMFAIVTQPAVPLRERNPWVSSALERVCLKGLSKHPDDRYATADEFLRELREL